MNMTREEPELDKDGKPVEGKTTTTTVDETLNIPEFLSGCCVATALAAGR